MSTLVSSLEAVFSADTSSLESGLNRANSAISGVGNQLQAVGGKISSFGAQLGAIAAPAVLAFTTATFAAMGFNESMTNANSILQMSETQISAVSDQILAMGMDAIAGPQAVAEAYYDIVGGVADVTTHMDILDTSIAVSEAGAANLQGTTAALVSVMNSYGYAAEDAAFAGDVFTRITATGIGTLDEFGAALPGVTGLASSLGIAFEDVGSMMAYFTTKGFSASQAATMVQSSMTALIKPNEMLKDAYAELGVANGEALIQMYGMDGALQAVAGTTVAANEGLPALLGTVEALGAATALNNEAWTEFDEAFKGTDTVVLNARGNLSDYNAEVINYNAAIEGSTKEARKFQRASPAAQFKLMKAQAAGLAIVVGTALLPAMVDLWDNMQPVLGALIQWVTANPELVSQIGLVALGVGALAGVLVPLGMVIGVVGSALSGIGVILGALSLPLILVVAAVAAFGYAWHENLFGLKDTAAPILEWLGGALETTAGFVTGLADAFKDGGLGGAIDYVEAKITGFADTLVNTDWGGVWDGFKNKASGVWDTLKQAWSVAEDFVQANLINPLTERVNNTDWGGVWATFKGKAGEVWNQFKAGLAIGADYILSNIVTPFLVLLASTDWGAIWAQMKAMAGQVWEQFKTGLALAGDFILTNVINPLAAQVVQFVDSGALYDAVYSLGTAMWSFLTQALTDDINRPNIIYDQIITPISAQIQEYAASGQLVEDIKAFGMAIWEWLKFAFAAYDGIGSFIYDNLVVPLYQSAVDADWSGVISSLEGRARTVVSALASALTQGIIGIGGEVQEAINALIPDSFSINIGSIKVGIDPFSKTIDFGSINVPLPNPFKTGTNWTGGGNRNDVAGVVHRQEAVIPTGGMMARVVPSPDGLIVSGGRGGGMGGGLVINGDVIIQGVQDPSGLFDKLQLEARRRGQPQLGAF